MQLFNKVQFGEIHPYDSHVRGPHDFPDTQDMYRPYGPNVTEDDDPKHYQSDPIFHSNQWMREMYHGESWDTPMSEEFEKPEHATYGHTVRRMTPL